jgi:hypothetical protein
MNDKNRFIKRKDSIFFKIYLFFKKLFQKTNTSAYLCHIVIFFPYYGNFF